MSELLSPPRHEHITLLPLFVCLIVRVYFCWVNGKSKQVSKVIIILIIIIIIIIFFFFIFLSILQFLFSLLLLSKNKSEKLVESPLFFSSFSFFSHLQERTKNENGRVQNSIDGISIESTIIHLDSLL